MKSMTYGTMPSFESFSKHLDSYTDNDGEHTSWDKRGYPMELAGREDQNAAAYATQHMSRADLEGITHFPGRYGKAGLRITTKKALYSFIKALAKGSEASESLASAMMSTLGYEWV